MAAPNSSFSFPCPHSHFILSRNQKTGAVTENRKHHLNKHLSLPSIVLCSCLVKFSSCQICPSQYSFSLALFFFSQHTSISASYFGMPSGPDGSTTEGQHFFFCENTFIVLFPLPPVHRGTSTQQRKQNSHSSHRGFHAATKGASLHLFIPSWVFFSVISKKRKRL